MKIGYYAKPGFLSDIEYARLKARLPEHEIVDWPQRHRVPADDFDVLVVSDSLDATTIAGQPRLFFIQATSAGYEGIDIDAATAAGIWVGSAPSADTGNAVSVAELAVMLMIGASRRLNRALASIRDHDLATNHLSTALFGKSACIVGLGSIGRALATRLHGFGMLLRGTDDSPNARRTALRPLPPIDFSRPFTMPIMSSSARPGASRTHTSSMPASWQR